MNPVEQHLDKKLKERELQGNQRKLSTARTVTDLYSNDYLGLATSGLLHSELKKHSEIIPTGSTGSRLLSGNSKETEALEQTIAQFHKAETALIFNSGYDANLGLLSSLGGRHTIYIYDERCHASIIDGIQLAQSHKKYKFRHNDIQHLAERLNNEKDYGEIIIVIESVYSMDGNIAPIMDICELTEKYKAVVIVDEAHATGVIGKKGEGLVSSLELESKVFARMHTFGKALGCHGAAVLGSTQLKNYLINFARSFIYSTALPPHTINTISYAYEYLSSSTFSNDKLHELIKYFREQVSKSGYDNWVDSITSIQALIIGDNTKTKQLATTLQKAGLQINPILSPTVPEGMERLRVCLHAFNTKEEIDLLMHVLKNK